jgi:hypothetical protein
MLEDLIKATEDAPTEAVEEDIPTDNADSDEDDGPFFRHTASRFRDSYIIKIGVVMVALKIVETMGAVAIARAKNS